MSEEIIWYDDIANLFDGERKFAFLPLHTMTFEAKINAIVRFCIYLGVILALVQMDSRYLLFGIVAMTLSYPFYEFDKKDRVKAEAFLKSNDIDIIDNKVCTRSTIENPFMNPSVVDIVYKPNRPEACDITKPEIKTVVDQNFSERVFKDATDIWGKNYAAREFYTMPSTTIPNKQGEFAEWLYGTGATCKEGGINECLRNNYRHMLR
jgi:hypothetical protein